MRRSCGSCSRASAKRFNLHEFLLDAKVNAVEIATAIVFFWWLYHALMSELR